LPSTAIALSRWPLVASKATMVINAASVRSASTGSPSGKIVAINRLKPASRHQRGQGADYGQRIIQRALVDPVEHPRDQFDQGRLTGRFPQQIPRLVQSGDDLVAIARRNSTSSAARSPIGAASAPYWAPC
jgi:hypothetical protein